MTSTGFGGRFLARVLLLAPLVGAACNPDSGDVGARRSALDIQSGTVTGSLTWGGAPVTGMAASTLKVRDSGLVWQTTVAPATGTLVPVVVPAGLYEVAIETSTTCERTAVDAVDVLPGATAVIATDLTASFGRVVASTILNGAPYDAKLRIFSSCSTEFTTGADGLVASLLTEGTYTARITLADSSLFQERTFTVVAGQTTDLGVVSFSGGTIRGTVRRNGTQLQNQQFLHQVRAAGISGTAHVLQDGTYNMFGIHAPGTYTVGLYPSTCNSPLTERTVTVAAGVPTVVDFDIGPLMSLVTGRVTVDGAAPDFLSVTVGSNACYPLVLAGNGQFSGYLAPGDYTGFVRANNTQLTTFPIAVAPGAAPVDVGTIAIQSGTVQGTVTWNGSSFAEASVRLSATATRSAAGSASVDGQGHYELPHTLAGDRTVSLSTYCDQQVVERVVSVGGGATATADFDVTSLLGRVTANVTFDGVPALGNYDVDLFPEACTMWNVFDGGLLLPGTHTATIRSFVDNRRHVVTFDVAAGQTTDLGVIDVPLNAGTVEGTVVWKGAPVSTIGEYFMVRLLLDQDGLRSERLARVSEDGRFHFDSVASATYELSLLVTNAGFVLERQVVRVMPNSTITWVFDLTLTHGRATGTLSVNGTADYKLLFDWPNPYFPFPGGRDGGDLHEGRLLNHDAQGRFAAYFEHRSSSLSIFLPGQSTLPGSNPFVRFPLAITKGHSVDVDGEPTDAGSDVTVMLNGDDLYEDVGAIRITFTTVTNPGSTTVVATDTGPPLPAGYQVSSRYWNLDTTAIYSGDIHICIHYDPAEVTGSESALEFLHDVSGWDNIRIDLGTDVEKNVICGTTTSFSPFVLAIPPNTPPTVNVPAALTVEAKGPAGASVAFTASATDAETGPLVATCVPPSGSTFPIGTTNVTCSAKDSGSLSGSASFAVTVRDSVGPVPVVPATVVAYATTTAGAKVTYAKPTATDAVDGARPTTCAPASGSTFKPGKTTVTCTAADSRGNAGSASFTVWVQYQAPTDGSFFLFPVRANGTSIFRIGHPVPVRFKLTGASAGITNLTAKLVVTKISNVVQGTTEDTSDETQDDTDFLFKYRPLLLKWYAYRWKTRGETQGTYRLRADLGDGVTHEINVSLRK